jgi:hypothetical protein
MRHSTVEDLVLLNHALLAEAEEARARSLEVRHASPLCERVTTIMNGLATRHGDEARLAGRRHSQGAVMARTAAWSGRGGEGPPPRREPKAAVSCKRSPPLAEPAKAATAYRPTIDWSLPRLLGDQALELLEHRSVRLTARTPNGAVTAHPG